MVFNASLENMTDEQRTTALGMREQSLAKNVSLNSNAGLTDLMMGGGQSANMSRQFNHGARQG